MTANELADEFENRNDHWNIDIHWAKQTAIMLRQQQAEIEQLKALAISLSPNSNLIYTRIKK